MVWQATRPLVTTTASGRGVMVGRGEGYGRSSSPLGLHITSVLFSWEYIHTLLYNLFLKQYVINLKEKSKGRPQGLTHSLFNTLNFATVFYYQKNCKVGSSNDNALFLTPGGALTGVHCPALTCVIWAYRTLRINVLGQERQCAQMEEWAMVFSLG